MIWYLAIGAADAYGFDRYVVRTEEEWASLPRFRMLVFMGNTLFWLPINLWVLTARMFKK